MTTIYFWAGVIVASVAWALFVILLSIYAGLPRARERALEKQVDELIDENNDLRAELRGGGA